MEPRDRPATTLTPAPVPDTVSATSGLRMAGYALLIAVLTFVQRPGLLVGDTKFDLVVAPGRFLARAGSMWDADAAYGQIQNQAYGYFFPMGPFFWLGDQVALPMWVVQRLWWTLLLCLAFYGVVLLARALRLGSPGGQVLAGFAFAFSVHVSTIIGGSSVEAWPSALAPWVLLCLVRGAEGGSERRWAALAGLATAACGGVNAVAVAVVLPLGFWWIVTRGPGARRRVLFTWWFLATLLGTLWWLVPLLLLGGYSFPFLDYIENATITTTPTGLLDVVQGSSDWVAYVDARTFQAGHYLATAPFLVLDAALVTAAGLVGLARRDNPHRTFLFLGVVTGVVLVSFGYAGPGAGFGADARQALLDGSLAPLRNLHKFDAVLRLPLVLGLAHLVGRLRSEEATAAGPARPNRTWPLIAMVAVVGLAAPWYLPRIAPAGPVQEVPGYWTQAARELNATSDGSRVLVVPAAAFGTYLWGSPRDDVLQPLMTTPWVVRNVIPLAEPGNVVLLDSLTRALESGRPSDRLATVLADNGIGRLVVRNDLNRFLTGAPDPTVLHQTLDRSPGLSRTATFGPELGAPAVHYLDDVRVANSDGVSGSYHAVEVYTVTAGAAPASLHDAADVPVRLGAPGGELAGDGTPGPWLLAGDDLEADDAPAVELTDGLRRREEAFAEVRTNQSATMTADEPWRFDRPIHQRELVDDQARWESVVRWSGGVSAVEASSSQAWADTAGAVRRDAAPGAALDGDEQTAWQSSPASALADQWWEVLLDPDTDVQLVSITGGGGSRVPELVLSNGQEQVTVDAPDEGQTISVNTRFGPSDRLRITPHGVGSADLGVLELAEVEVSGVEPRRTVVLPDPPETGAVTSIDLVRDPDVSACVLLEGNQVCRDVLGQNGDDGDVVDRQFTLRDPASYDVSLTGSLRSGPLATNALAARLPYTLLVTGPARSDVRASRLALVDHDPATVWEAGGTGGLPPTMEVAFPRSHRFSIVRLALPEDAPSAAATHVTLTAGGSTREVDLGPHGRGRFRPLTGSSLTITVDGVAPGYDGMITDQTRLPLGVAELRLRAPGSTRNLLRVPSDALDLPCGVGPSLTIDDLRVSTRVDLDLLDLVDGTASVVPCRTTVDLGAGTHDLVAGPTDAIRVDHIRLAAPDAVASDTAQPEVVRWEAEHRELEVPEASERRLLVVSENFNPGWHATLGGTTLDAQRVDGWRQGWWVPAGSGGRVVLTFEPGSAYDAGLVAGGVVALVLLVVALVAPRRRRRRGRPAVGARPVRVLVWLVCLGAGGLLAGWVGLAAMAVAVVLAATGVVRRPGVEVVGGLLLFVAGAWTAWDRADAETLTNRPETQWLVIAGLALALVALDDGGRLRFSFRLRKGRSTT